MSTLVSALFATGGPAPQGSMRHILLRRNGATVADVDLYDLLVNGDKSDLWKIACPARSTSTAWRTRIRRN